MPSAPRALGVDRRRQDRARALADPGRRIAAVEVRVSRATSLGRQLLHAKHEGLAEVGRQRVQGAQEPRGLFPARQLRTPDRCPGSGDSRAASARRSSPSGRAGACASDGGPGGFRACSQAPSSRRDRTAPSAPKAWATVSWTMSSARCGHRPARGRRRAATRGAARSGVRPRPIAIVSAAASRVWMISVAADPRRLDMAPEAVLLPAHVTLAVR